MFELHALIASEYGIGTAFSNVEMRWAQLRWILRTAMLDGKFFRFRVGRGPV
jgi:hypothetical protein